MPTITVQDRDKLRICEMDAPKGEGEGPIVQIVTSEEHYLILVNGELASSRSVYTLEDDPSYALDMVRELAEKLGLRVQWGEME